MTSATVVRAAPGRGIATAPTPEGRTVKRGRSPFCKGERPLFGSARDRRDLCEVDLLRDVREALAVRRDGDGNCLRRRGRRARAHTRPPHSIRTFLPVA